MLKNLLANKSCLFNQIRCFGKQNKKYLYPANEGQKYENIIYYPRIPDHKDPEITPSKLFRVERVKPVKGNPYWERRILRDLGLFTRGQIAVVKNIPENNARLWKVKHLVKISPITFPYGEPTAADVNHTFLKENGECLVTKEIEIKVGKVEAAEDFLKDPKRMDGETLKRDSRMKWLSGW